MEEVILQIKAGQISEQAKRAIVMGFMPLEPEVLLEAIYHIVSKQMDLIEEAKAAVESMPETVLTGFFENRELVPELLGFYLVNFEIKSEPKSQILLNPNTPAPDLTRVAPGIDPKLLDLVVNNQVKILEDPELIQALRQNPGIGVNHIQRLDEYERLLLRELVDPAETLEQKNIEDVEREALEHAKDFVRTFGKESVSIRDMVSDGDEEKKDSLIKQLSVMTVPQRVQAAIKGNREVRQTLIRDANKLVSSAVIKSPRITEAEVEFYSNMRSLNSEVIRSIALNREWMSNYKIIHNLVKNPRTPIDISLKLLPRLVQRDMKQLEMDKGVPDAIRRTAKRMWKSAKR
ncbi:MAG: hypothetical protein H6510_03845 [Acidobacteria bacterium]|nr:hypothetical protein [Acidobacteriota bacterium]MCB9396927.1 hypothetical protein [Acidobacteriota bacterium]